MIGYHIIDMEQGSAEWLALRKKKVTATDAVVIMGENPWKKPSQLLKEKLSNENNTFSNKAMDDGRRLEPIARDLFILQTGIKVKPVVVVKDDWAMASLDGMSDDMKIVEIKCPNKKEVHDMAIAGQVPSYYRSQLQHQMFVTGVEEMYYFSFDGIDGVIVPVKRDDEYISRMVVEEKKFFDKMMAKEVIDDGRTDLEWLSLAEKWKSLSAMLKELEQQENEIRSQLIQLANNKPARGWGVTATPFERKGSIDYNSIPELKSIDLEKHRKPSTISWRITNE